MRTKTLLLTAALSVATVATSMADVFSVNVVGYVNTTVPPGFSIINNPLNTTNNTLSSLLPNPPANTTIYKFNGSYQIANFALDDNNNLSWDNNLTLAPGEGAWIRNPASTNVVLTFVGEVLQGVQTNAIPAGFSLKGSIVPQAGQLDTALGYPPSANDTIYLYRNGTYKICNYALDDNNNLNWDNIPDPAVGEGFWIRTPAAKEWVRTFTAN
jgi:hypothetical protein